MQSFVCEKNKISDFERDKISNKQQRDSICIDKKLSKYRVCSTCQKPFQILDILKHSSVCLDGGCHYDCNSESILDRKVINFPVWYVALQLSQKNPDFEKFADDPDFDEKLNNPDNTQFRFDRSLKVSPDRLKLNCKQH